MRWCTRFILVLFAAGSVGRAAESGDALDALNTGFLAHVRGLASAPAGAAAAVAEAWESYRTSAPESFVPDALALLYEDYRAGLAAYDEQRYDEAARLLSPLQQHEDPYLAANARYFAARARVAQGLLEEAEAELDAAGAVPELAPYTPYTAHLAFLRAYCQAGNLRFDAALETLKQLQARFPQAAEPVQVGMRQLQLELERRERGTLDEVATVMEYSAARLNASDTTPRLRSRQDEIITLLDRLIEETEQQEQQQSSSAQRRSAVPQMPRQGAEQSVLPESGQGQIGELHRAPQADPGEMWGQLPPAEREKLLDALRERFPSRYRQLVEQYYRSLAEEE